MTKIRLIINALLLIFLISCVSDSNFIDNPNEGYEEKAISLRIVQSPAATRNLDESRPICDGEYLQFNTGDLFLINALGNIVQRWHIVACDGTSATETNIDPAVRRINRNDLDVGVPLPSVPASVREVVIVGNYNGTTPFPASGNISGVTNRVLNIDSQLDALDVNLWRRTSVPTTATVDGDRRYYPVDVFLSPTVARFEIADITGRGEIQSFTVQGIFIDNFYRQARVDGTILGTRRNGMQDEAMFLPVAYATNYSSLFSWNVSGLGTGATITGGFRVSPGTTAPGWNCNVEGCTNNHATAPNVWGYQVFAQSHDHTHNVTPPSIVIRLSSVTLRDGTTLTNQFVTINSFFVRDEHGNYGNLTGIRYGNVYRIAPGMLEFDEFDLRPRPNDDPIGIRITVQLAMWNARDMVHPIRQPNPVSRAICPNVAFTINLAEAVGQPGITYRWEQSLDGGATFTTVATTQNLAVTAANAHTFLYTHVRRVAMWSGGELASSWALLSSPVRRYDFPEYVEIGGARWATRNVGAPFTFAAHPGDAGLLFQWNCSNDIGHSNFNPRRSWHPGAPDWAPSAFDWASGNDLIGLSWNNGRGTCPEGWRLPNNDEMLALLNASSGPNTNAGRWLTADEAVNEGLGCQPGRVFGPNSDTAPFNPATQIFLPAAGQRDPAGNTQLVNSAGLYWSGTPTSIDNFFATNAYNLRFRNDYTGYTGRDNRMFRNERARGMSVRCVQYIPPPFTNPSPVSVTICYNTSHTFNVPAAEGVPGITYQWYRSTDGTTWTLISGATGQNHTTGNLTQNTYFRRDATDGVFVVAGTPALVTVYAAFITPHPVSVAICHGVSHTFNVGVPTGGGTATITYQWQQSTNGTTWTNIAGATGQNFTTPALTTNTHFRRIATRGSCTVTSNAALVTVLPVFTTPHPVSVTICNGFSHTFTVGAPTGGGTGTITYQWQQSTNGGTTWTNIAGATSQNYTTPILTANRHFRRIATRGSCTVTSNAALITVAESIVVGGTRWHCRNVGAPGTFAARPELAGMFYRWNNRVGWSSTNPRTSSPTGQTWATSVPSPAPGAIWAAANNPCPAGWRIPTHAEMQALVNAGSTWGSNNGVAGRFFGTAPNRIFLPATGGRNASTDPTGHTLNSVGATAHYWSNAIGSSTAIAGVINISGTSGSFFPVSTGGLTVHANPVRCVQ